VRFEWRPASTLVLEGVPRGHLSAELFTGAGEPGLAPGLYLGQALVPVGGSAGPRELVLDDGPGGLGLSELWVRLAEPEVGS